jgi:hypothetical protein
MAGGMANSGSGRSGRRLNLLVVGVLVFAAVAPPAAALDIGLQSAGDDGQVRVVITALAIKAHNSPFNCVRALIWPAQNKKQACSRTCESDHCTSKPSVAIFSS